MEVIKGLIPGMIFLGIAMVAVLIYAVRRGQYEDMEGDAHRILLDDDDPNLPEAMREERRKARAKAADQRMPDADD